MSITAVHAEPIHGAIRPDLAIISSLGRHVVGNYVLVRVEDNGGRHVKELHIAWLTARG